MNKIISFIQDVIIDHIWGIIEGAMLTSAAGLAANVGIQIGVNFPTESLKSAYETYEMVGDIVGTISLITFIPSVISYLIGRLLGKYNRR